MANFCTRCGRPLQEGEVCTCGTEGSQAAVNQAPPVQQQAVNQAPPAQQTVNQVPPVQPQMGYQTPPQMGQPQMGYQVPPQMGQGQPNAQAQAAKELANQVKGSFLQVLTKPVTVGRTVVATADVKIAVAFFILQGIASSLFAMVVGSSGLKLLTRWMSLFGAGIEFPYMRVFLVTLIVSVLQSCILAGLLWLGHMVLKCETTYPKMMSAAAIRSAMMVPTILVAIVLFEIKPVLGFFLFVVGNIWGFLTMTTAMDSHIPDEKKDIFPLVVSIAILLFIVICIFVMSKAWVYYLPEDVKSLIDMDWGSLLDDWGSLLETIAGFL